MIQLEPNVKNEEVKTTGRPKTKEEMLQEQLVYTQRLANDLIIKLERTQS
ncbi:hypothetical protein NSQ93_04050 [Bacillus sp. FSL W8-0445]|jgi:hypothetical protein|uniref:Uncharacterized protein n=1 Tax=Bacillus licheniformis TaxID=1402 RepID=A0A8B5Y6P5_BACLI|nr:MULTISPECIES: hypothetical protein [Bacillus]MBJ7887927.1 hypothetical protein [Bacillaceae bacterium HSR45]KYC70578.1 hypothetical protein B4092_0977 [Bacillus licheniformis]KYC82567.1 hypothetical protein B4091_1411 [Bacillus licheniformis]MBU8782347.1 hypothetical protein [Bacillus licheniformis]MBW7634645.1 hypothetical protein [Bacillus licheniformis]